MGILNDVEVVDGMMPTDAGDCNKYPEMIPWDNPSYPDYLKGYIPTKTVVPPKDEEDPNGIPLKQPGAKADANKSPVTQGCLQYFPRALLEVAKVSLKGAEKYSWKGWEHVDDGQTRYNNALGRHILYEAIDGPYDSDTGELHAAQIAWNALARLELILRGDEAKSPAFC